VTGDVLCVLGFGTDCNEIEDGACLLNLVTDSLSPFYNLAYGIFVGRHCIKIYIPLLYIHKYRYVCVCVCVCFCV
jgi:hypothetical protein